MAVEDSKFNLTDQIMDLDIKARPDGFFQYQDDSIVEENAVNSQDYSNVEEDTLNSQDHSNVEEDTLNYHQGYSNVEENYLNSNKEYINDMILMRMDNFVKTGNHKAYSIPLLLL